MTDDLLSIIQRTTGLSFKGPYNNFAHGPEYAGPCPLCGTGNDRFRVFPQSPVRPHFFCRKCERHGDAIQFIRDLRDCSFVEACEELDIDPNQEYRPSVVPLAQDSDEPPCKAWQEFGLNFVERAERYLWRKAPEMLSYLHKRGMNDDTIRAARIGYCPSWKKFSFSDWGLNPEHLTDRQREKGVVSVPDGLVIPWFFSDHLWKIAVKRPGQTPDYGQLIGSRDTLYNFDSLQRGKPVLLLEGEMDVTSAVQTCSDLISPIGTGSTVKGRLPLAISRLVSWASCVLIGFDNDDAGNEGADWWLTTLGMASMRLLPWSHDVNDMLREGKSIRKWVSLGLELFDMPVERTEKAVSNPSVYRPPDICSQCDNPSVAILDDNTAYCTQHWKAYRAKTGQEFLPEELCSIEGCNEPLDRVDECLQGYCETHWQEYQSALALSEEELLNWQPDGRLITASIPGGTISIVPQDYTLAEHVSHLQEQQCAAERLSFVSPAWRA